MVIGSLEPRINANIKGIVIIRLLYKYCWWS